MKKLLLISLVCLLAGLLTADIVSTTTGGNWANPSTWIGGVVPNSSTNVQIQGNVLIDITGECLNLTVTPSGRIANPGYYVGQVTVYGNCYNHGQLVDSGVPGGELRMVVLGNIVNTQLMTCEYVYFAGESDHTMTSSGTFSPTHFLNMDYAMVTLLSDLSLTGTHVYLPNLNLNGGFTSHISLSGGFFEHTNIQGGNGASLNLSNDAYLYYLTATEIVFSGTILIGSGVTIGNLNNNGTIYNRVGADQTLIVSGRLDNHGTIGSNPGGDYLNLELQGDIYDYQTISPHYLSIGSAGIHDIWQSPVASPISAPVINSNGDHRLLSDLRIVNSEVSWNSNYLALHNGDSGYILSLSGGSLVGVYLEGVNGSTLALSNNAWIAGLSANMLSFSGTVLVGDNVELGNLINNGTMRGLGDNQHTLMVWQRLENYGSIADASSGNFFYVNLYGDLINYGQISNYQCTLYGAEDQNVLRSAGSSILCSGGFRLYNHTGYAQWYFNGQPTDGVYDDFRTIDPAISGVWTPRIGSIQGKNTIIGSAGVTCPTPQNLHTQVIGGNLRLSWDQVPGALYYTVYGTNDPATEFTAYKAKIFDYFLGDGSVTCEFEPSDVFRFYRVSAGN